MYWLPPLNFTVDTSRGEIWDFDLLIKYLRKRELPESRYPGINKALDECIRGNQTWSIGEYAERRKHLKRVGTIYHPDNYFSDEEALKMFAPLMKSINAEAERIDNNTEKDYREEPYAASTRFSRRFSGQDTTNEIRNIVPIEVHLTLSNLYNRDTVHIAELGHDLLCDGDIDDGSHRIIKNRRVIFRVKTEIDIVKEGLNYITTVHTNPIQILYYTHKVILPSGEEVLFKPGDPLIRKEKGFSGKDGVGNLVVNYNVMKMPVLSRDIQGQLHTINLTLFYAKNK